MASGAMEGAVDADMLKCEQLRIAASTLSDDFMQQCLCLMRNNNSGVHCTTEGAARRLSADDHQLLSDQLTVLASNGTDIDPTEPTDSPDDNLINSDVFIYVIVFIVIVYFLTFLYLCMKKRQRAAEDAETGGGGGTVRARGTRATEQDRPPPYDEVMGSSGAVGGKSAEPPTYAEVLARSQQLDQLDKAEQGGHS